MLDSNEVEITTDDAVERIIDGEVLVFDAVIENAKGFADIGVTLQSRKIPYHTSAVSRTQIAFHYGSEVCKGRCD